ncbi:MAG: hypothetical protein V1887_03920 [Candidatus Aenigmatarchaeota archaeon]
MKGNDDPRTFLLVVCNEQIEPSAVRYGYHVRFAGRGESKAEIGKIVKNMLVEYFGGAGGTYKEHNIGEIQSGAHRPDGQTVALGYLFLKEPLHRQKPK